MRPRTASLISVLVLLLLPVALGRSLVGQGARQRNAVGLFVSKSQRGNRVGPGSHLLRKSHLKLRNTPPDVMTVAQSESLVIECEAGGNPPPTIHWLKNGLRIGQDLTGSERTEQEVNPEGAPMLGLSFTRSRLFIDCASSQYDEAEYTCVAQNPYHRISKSTKVKVTKIGSAHSSPLCLVKKSFVAPGVPARITMWTHTRLELMGSTVQLFCRPIGSPKPSVSWFGPDDTELQNSDKYKVLENGDLEIRNIAWNDMGGYTCTAENSHGVDRTSTFLYPTLPDKV
nr:zwei Ig domain protein zig-2-like [Rhipicephalus microplus]